MSEVVISDTSVLIIFHKISELNLLKKVYDWDNLTNDQKQGIHDSIEEIDAGKGISNDKVISKYRKKYSHV